jgi:ferredoxin
MTYIKILVNRNKCCYCGACISVCPVKQGALELEEVILKVSHDICIECGMCVQICPVGALSMTKTNNIYQK